MIHTSMHLGMWLTTSSISKAEQKHIKQKYRVLVKQETGKMKQNEREITPKNYWQSPVLCLRPWTTTLFFTMHIYLQWDLSLTWLLNCQMRLVEIAQELPNYLTRHIPILITEIS